LGKEKNIVQEKVLMAKGALNSKNLNYGLKKKKKN